MKKYTIALSAIAACIASQAFANTANPAYTNQFTQEIHVVNLLANTDLPDPGMTPTTIVVEYYNGNNRPCWSNKLTYREGTTIHAGPTQGCLAKVTSVVISPTLTAGKLKSYLSPFNVQIDPAKYTTQIMILQDTSPTFDTKSGLVTVQGTVKASTQAQFKE